MSMSLRSDSDCELVRQRSGSRQRERRVRLGAARRMFPSRRGIRTARKIGLMKSVKSAAERESGGVFSRRRINVAVKAIRSSAIRIKKRINIFVMVVITIPVIIFAEGSTGIPCV